MYYSDYHIHTQFSSDCQIPMQQMIEKSISCGLKEIAITDHIDFDYPDPNMPFLFDYHEYRNQIEYFRQKYKGQITIRLGVELGLQPHIFTQIEQYLSNYEFDFVIGSTHCLEKKELYGNYFYQGKTKEEAYTIYFQEVLENVKWYSGFQVYGHMDYVNRYGEYQNNQLDYFDYQPFIDDILKALIQNGKGLEINTSGFKYGLNRAHPQLSILKRYRQLGGEIVTIGSDAHHPSYISDHFSDAYQMLEESGFHAIATFENRKLKWIDVV